MAKPTSMKLKVPEKNSLEKILAFRKRKRPGESESINHSQPKIGQYD